MKQYRCRSSKSLCFSDIIATSSLCTFTQRRCATLLLRSPQKRCLLKSRKPRQPRRSFIWLIKIDEHPVKKLKGKGRWVIEHMTMYLQQTRSKRLVWVPNRDPYSSLVTLDTEYKLRRTLEHVHILYPGAYAVRFYPARAKANRAKAIVEEKIENTFRDQTRLELLLESARKRGMVHGYEIGVKVVVAGRREGVGLVLRAIIAGVDRVYA